MEPVSMGLAGGLLGAGKNPVKALTRLVTGPTPPEARPAITTETTAVQQAANEAAQRRSRARGSRSTILSQSFLSPDSPALQSTFGS